VIQKFCQGYNDFFNKKIENSTFVVLLIVGMVVVTATLVPARPALANYTQANVI